MPPRPFNGPVAVGGKLGKRQQHQRHPRQQHRTLRWQRQPSAAAGTVISGFSWLASLVLQVLLLPLPLSVLFLATPAQAMRADRVAELRRQTVEMFFHGFDNYMQIAFPEDELRPVSCTPLSRDSTNPHLVELNDVLGNYSLTLIDSLSTLAILASAPLEDGPAARTKALRSFQDGVAALVRLYGDGHPGPSGAGERARGFDLDSKVQVFETVIRGVGGLLSAHLFAVGDLPIAGYVPPLPPQNVEAQEEEEGEEYVDASLATPWPDGFHYDGQLLRLALDLASRLLPAFYTPTGLPYPRVNLRYGIPFYANSPLHSSSGGGSNGDAKTARSGPAEITETCSAGAGSLVLEFTVLSRLTDDPRFEQLAKRAFWAVWYRRSAIGLIGAGVDAEQGRWIGAYAVIGAGADSFFEYALKTHILLSGQEAPPNRTRTAATAAAHAPPWHDPNTLFPALSDEENAPEAFLEAWHLAHAAIKRHLYSDREHPHYVNVNLYTGSLAAPWIDSLGAYYPGLLTLAGEVDEAIGTNLLYTAVWARYAALPERWSLRDRTVEGGLGWWPLRPEFIESVYHLYRATRDPWYLYVGEMVQRDIQRRCRTACGWAGLQDVVTGQKADRMESFFLGETAKYMYLLYDDKHPLNALDAAFVFSTEGHPLFLPRRQRQRQQRRNPAVKKKEAQPHQKKQKQKRRHGADVASAVGVYDDNSFTNTCPLPPRLAPLTGSAVAGRRDIYHAARMLSLHLPAAVADTSSPARGLRLNGDDEPLHSNQSFFPWTLPPTMLPANGTSAQVLQPIEMALEFSLQPGGVGVVLSGPHTLGRIASDKIRVLSTSGLKLQFQLETSDSSDSGGNGEHVWRITRVNGVPLGRDEMLVMDRALVSHVADTRFALVRDPIVVKLHHMHRAIFVDEDSDSDGNDSDYDDEDENDEDDGDDEDETDDDIDSINDKTGEAEGNDESVDGLNKMQQQQQIRRRKRRRRQQQRSSGTAIGTATASAPVLSLSPSGLATFVKSVWHQFVTTAMATGSTTTAAATVAAAAAALRSPERARAAVGSPPSLAKSPKRPALWPRQRRPPYINLVLNSTGVTPTGLGAAPLPAVDTVAGAWFPTTGLVPSELLPWRTVYAGGQACDGPLPDTVSRDHQVLVLRRGGCSFSEKLANVPSFVPGRRRLQLVVVVSDDDDVQVADSASSSPLSASFHDDRGSFVRPLLDEPQRTPSGLVRLQPLAMVMVGGGEETYQRLASALQLGLTRRYAVESHGVRIRNLILDDGDEA